MSSTQRAFSSSSYLEWEKIDCTGGTAQKLSVEIAEYFCNNSRKEVYSLLKLGILSLQSGGLAAEPLWETSRLEIQSLSSTRDGSYLAQPHDLQNQGGFDDSSSDNWDLHQYFKTEISEKKKFEEALVLEIFCGEGEKKTMIGNEKIC